MTKGFRVKALILLSQRLQFSELSQRNKGSIFSQFDVFINAFTLSPLNCVSSRFFLEAHWQEKLFDAFQHIQTNNVE